MRSVFSVILLVGLMIVGSTRICYSQRYAIIDTRYILNKMPEYADADVQLKKMSMQWQKEVNNAQSELDKMRKEYQAEQYMLTDELQKKREIEISNKEKAVLDLNTRYFGYEGELFTQRKRLVQPIQDKIYNAAEQMAVRHGYDFILDKSEGITVIFADPKLNKSDELLSYMGVKAK
ncbi:MAG: OmpH family outer membrane protein [Chitinophagaceae bacterium]